MNLLPDTAAFTAVYTYLLGKTFLKKGSSPDPFPKTSSFVFPAVIPPIVRFSKLIVFQSGVLLREKRS